MISVNASMLIEWLGAEGALAGLERSILTNSDLMILARENGIEVDKRAPRKQIVIEIVMARSKRVDKPIEYLLQMSADELRRYFTERMVSNKELNELLVEVGIPKSGKVRGRLIDYAAREMSELGMYQRVARGNVSADSKRH